MKSYHLFPNRFKIIGFIIFIPSLILGLFSLINSYELSWLTLKMPITIGEKMFGAEVNLTDEIITIGLIAGLILIGFSSVKFEDEYVASVRLESLQWAVYIHAALLILATLFVYGIEYFNVLIFNMFTPLIIFNIRFHYLLFLKNEK